ncbi:MAG TPA: META domain-containing protein [Burkholderiales bacterium]|jgi:heat shock protein HslJ|nr:META domain-containing protein [Burkholderiales bacterium]
MTRVPHFTRLVIAVAVVFAALLLLPRSAAFAAPAVAIYRGETPPASGPGRRVELRLAADGKMTWRSDYRNNRPPITEEGRWNAISVEEIEVIVERRDGKQVEPSTVRLLKQGDTLATTAASAAEFGSQGLLLKLAKAASPPITTPVTGAVSPVGGWQWKGLISSAEKISVNQPERYRLQLQAGGKAQVLADCNRGQASYTFDGRSFSIKITGVTRAACPAGSLSDRYLQTLEAAVAQRVRGENLFLDLPADGGTMKFVRAK